MNWLYVGLIAVAVATGSQALAAMPLSQAALNRRQLSDCMTKQMAASKTISYNDASKLCKERIRSQGDGLSASNEAKPANAR